MIEFDLRTLLLAQSAITDIVGSSGVYCDAADQGTPLPYVLLTLMDSDPLKALDGTYGLEIKTFDIDCYGAEKPEAKQLSAAVKAFIKDYSGVAGDSTIHAVLLDDETDTIVRPEDGSGKITYLTTLDVQIQFTE